MLVGGSCLSVEYAGAKDFDLTRRARTHVILSFGSCHYPAGDYRAMGGTNILSRRALSRSLSSGTVCGLLALVSLLGPVPSATADDASPSPEPAITAPPSTEPAPEPVLPTLDPVPPLPDPVIPPVEEVIAPPAPPIEAPAEPVLPPAGPVPADVIPVVPTATPAALVPGPDVAAFSAPALEPSTPPSEPTMTTTAAESSAAAVVPGAPSSPASLADTRRQQPDTSPVGQAVSAATGSPLAVQLLTVVLLLGAGILYFRALGSKGMRTPSRSVK